MTRTSVPYTVDSIVLRMDSTEHVVREPEAVPPAAQLDKYPHTTGLVSIAAPMPPSCPFDPAGFPAFYGRLAAALDSPKSHTEMPKNRRAEKWAACIANALYMAMRAGVRIEWSTPTDCDGEEARRVLTLAHRFEQIHQELTAKFEFDDVLWKCVIHPELYTPYVLVLQDVLFRPPYLIERFKASVLKAADELRPTVADTSDNMISSSAPSAPATVDPPLPAIEAVAPSIPLPKESPPSPPPPLVQPPTEPTKPVMAEVPQAVSKQSKASPAGGTSETTKLTFPCDVGDLHFATATKIKYGESEAEGLQGTVMFIWAVLDIRNSRDSPDVSEKAVLSRISKEATTTKGHQTPARKMLKEVGYPKTIRQFTYKHDAEICLRVVDVVASAPKVERKRKKPAARTQNRTAL